MDAAGLAANDDAPLSSRLDAEVGFGLAVFGSGSTGTPQVGLGLSDTARAVRMGWRLSPARQGDAGGFELSLDAARCEAVNDDAPEMLRKPSLAMMPTLAPRRSNTAFKPEVASSMQAVGVIVHGGCAPVRAGSKVPYRAA